MRYTCICLFLYLTAIFGAGREQVQAQTYTYGLLHSFTGTPDAANPKEQEAREDSNAGLVRDSKGNLYGTTLAGGASNSGAVFKIDSDGAESVVYSFCSQPSCKDGSDPIAGLLLDTEGNIYGTTFKGGAYGWGTVFELSATGTETVLYDFCPDSPVCAGGQNPNSALVRDSEGNLYGTTYGQGLGPFGNLFKLSTSGTETVLHNFNAYAGDGLYPQGVLIGSDGNLYGTTSGGGDADFGTVFKVEASGTESVLYSFTGIKYEDGEVPNGGLVLDAEGNLYGTTYEGGYEVPGRGNGAGTIFKISPSGSETVLYRFGATPDGNNPSAGLVRDAKGNLYGTTYFGGGSAAGDGAVFEVNKDGDETILYAFSSKTPGLSNHPAAPLAINSKGDLYGVSYGGADKLGTVYDLLIASAATTTSLTSTPNPSTSGEAVTFTAVVSNGSKAPPNGETVSFMKGKTVLATGTLTGGKATFTTTTLAIGTSSVDAVYGGDTLFTASTSNIVKQVVK
jgi:uncharacterized repeat protein (TIGR03803 family)